jgi:predicted nucleic acid-binding protein
MGGHQIFLAAVTVSELRYGALAAGWGEECHERLDGSMQQTTVVPVSDRLLSTVAELRFACRTGYPLQDRALANDFWLAASAIHIGAPFLIADNIFSRAPGLTVHA